MAGPSINTKDKKPAKICYAELLLKDDMPKAVSIYKSTCLDENLSNHERVSSLVSFIQHVPDEGLDMLARFRDALKFYKGNKHWDHAQMLKLIALCPDVPIHERAYTACLLYNSSLITECYECFKCIATESDNPDCAVYQVDACKFLYSSEDDEYISVCRDVLLGILRNRAHDSKYRYSVIAAFANKNGTTFTRTLFNREPLKAIYNEDLMHELQTLYFFDTSNDVRCRILSGQNLLQMSCLSDEQRTKVYGGLKAIAQDTLHVENTRADAADVLLRLGTPDIKQEARDIINELGKEKDVIPTIYTNRQNIHVVDESIVQCIIKIVERSDYVLPSYTAVVESISSLVRSSNRGNSERLNIYQALYRIDVDTATFTPRNITMQELLCHMWACIHRPQRTADEQESMCGRLLDELEEMADTCGTGHGDRFINVLSGYDELVDIRIEWEDQIIANIAGRLNASIRDEQDDDLKGILAVGMLDTAETDDKKVFDDYITKTLKAIKKDMYVEFVEGKYVTEKKFETCFAKFKLR